MARSKMVIAAVATAVMALVGTAGVSVAQVGAGSHHVVKRVAGGGDQWCC